MSLSCVWSSQVILFTPARFKTLFLPLSHTLHSHLLKKKKKKRLQVAQRRICKKSFQNEHHPSCYMLSQNIMPLLPGYQFCSVGREGERARLHGASY